MWSSVDNRTPATLLAIWGASASDVCAVGGGGTSAPILHYNGTTWSSVSSGTDALTVLTGVWGSSSSDIWAAGADEGKAVLLHYDGATWSSVSTGTALSLEGVWGSSSTNVWAVGGGYSDTMLHGSR